MTHQMARGAQVAFGKSWLERQNIESQTVDVHSHIDGSLSYEENIKKMKRMLGMGGRSTQQATPTMSAGECDVAIGNYEAGYNGTTMKDACECGHPDACEDLERKKAKAAAPKQTGGYRAVEASPMSEAGQRIAFMHTWFKRQGINIQAMDKSSQKYKDHVAIFKKAHPPKPKKTPTPKAKPKSKPKTTSGTIDKFRQLLIKHPDRRTKTIERMKGVLASHTLGRDFGGSMEDYYKQRPDLKRTDEGLQALITEAGRGTIKATPPQTISPAKEEYLRKRDRIDKEQFEKWGIGAPPTPRLPPLTPPAAAPKRKAAKKKTAAKPAKAKPQKTAPAAPKLTATQAKRLAATGRVTVKRNGKFVTITR